MTRSIRAVLCFLLSMLALAPLYAAERDHSLSGLDARTEGYCLEYETMDTSHTLSYAREIDKSEYKLRDVLTQPVCEPRKIGAHNKITIMQLTVEDPFTRFDHMQTMYKYIIKKRKDESIWLDAVNALNTDGMTMLDYIHFVLGNGNFTSDEARAQVGKVRQFVCEHGGVYKKYPQSSCSDPSF